MKKDGATQNEIKIDPANELEDGELSSVSGGEGVCPILIIEDMLNSSKE